jgi:mannose-6-phosphate isomerase-like protein (cupin superfamily)
MRILTAILAIILMVPWGTATAQNLDGRPFDPDTEPDIDLFISGWKSSMPSHTHGSLIERPILTKGSNPDPSRKGAVLEYLNRYVHATLPARAETTPTTLVGEQEILFVLTGTGSISGGGETFELSPEVGVLVPAGLEFTMRADADADLTLYLVSEPVPEGFRPNDRLLVRTAGEVPFAPPIVHWAHIDTYMFGLEDGLGTLELVTTCTFSPMTIGHPHSHDETTEEVWTVLRGTNLLMLGKELRYQMPGTAYLIPNNNTTPHSNINGTDDILKFFYFARYRDHEVRP